LLRTLYLWGAHLSRSENWLNRENELLLRALSETAVTLSTSSHPHYTVHTIQSEVLLAYYFFRTGRSIEARRHATAAASIVLSCGFHKLRSNSSSRPTDLVLATSDPFFISQSEDPIQEGEKLNALWTVVTLCKNLASTFEHPASVCGIFEASGVVIDAPWPLDMESYKEVSPFPSFPSTALELTLLPVVFFIGFIAAAFEWQHGT
jgi:hypothetical protein